MTYEAMIELLSKAKGVNLETFDWKGNKSLADLHREIEERDVTLHIHEQTGEAIRVALSV